jgi:hypothetical protein
LRKWFEKSDFSPLSIAGLGGKIIRRTEEIYMEEFINPLGDKSCLFRMHTLKYEIITP